MFETYRIVRILNEWEVVINAGNSSGLSEGDLLEIFETGEEIYDLDNKTSLGTLDIIKGKIEIKHLYENISLCRSANYVFKEVEDTNYFTKISKSLGSTTIKEIKVEKPLNIDLTQAQKTKDVDMKIKLGDMVRGCL